MNFVTLPSIAKTDGKIAVSGQVAIWNAQINYIAVDIWINTAAAVDSVFCKGGNSETVSRQLYNQTIESDNIVHFVLRIPATYNVLQSVLSLGRLMCCAAVEGNLHHFRILYARNAADRVVETLAKEEALLESVKHVYKEIPLIVWFVSTCAGIMTLAILFAVGYVVYKTTCASWLKRKLKWVERL